MFPGPDDSPGHAWLAESVEVYGYGCRNKTDRSKVGYYEPPHYEPPPLHSEVSFLPCFQKDTSI